MQDHPSPRASLPMRPAPLHLRAAGVSLVLDATDGQLPTVLHWGADLGDLDDECLIDLRRANVRQQVSGGPDANVPVSLLPEQSRGWLGTPGITGNRGGADFSVRFEVTAVHVVENPAGGGRVQVSGADSDAALGLELYIELLESGLVRTRADLTNLGEGDYHLDGVCLALPVPLAATELLDFTGRHLRERSAQRSSFTHGTHLREGRRGRTGADATGLIVAGESGFGFRTGRAWALHTAWSGNHRTLAERLPSGDSILAGGELLLSGEVDLAPAATYTSPWVYGSYGAGLDQVAGRFHSYLRSRSSHPSTPRPVIANVWEAVFFDHDLEKLTALADAAAEVGVERFVLDDGWFRGRRSDNAGLGDWFVDEEVWPDGLGPLIDHVEKLGMQFGLWVEPEMVNPDSDLARSHPEWIMATGSRLPPAFRNQQVLDLGNPGAYAYILERLDAIVSEYQIRYLKWDHNRDLMEAGHRSSGRAAVHEQTLAVYRLIDELKRRHAGLEIESCASGGARVDLEILERTDRIWASDCIDAHERHSIQQGTEMLLAPELIGAHIGSPVNHSTGRQLSLDFRAGMAFGYHFGIEWNLASATAEERRRVAEWVAAYKKHRGLLHSGVVVHSDHPDPAIGLRGVIAQDGSEAIFTLAALETSVWAPQGRITLPGLDPDTNYEVNLLAPGDRTAKVEELATVAWSRSPLRLSGRALAEAGLQIPALLPDRLVLIHLQAR